MTLGVQSWVVNRQFGFKVGGFFGFLDHSAYREPPLGDADDDTPRSTEEGTPDGTTGRGMATMTASRSMRCETTTRGGGVGRRRRSMSRKDDHRRVTFRGVKPRRWGVVGTRAAADGTDAGDGDESDDVGGETASSRGGYIDYGAALAKEFAKTEVPALLFPQRETLLPGSKMTLHLYEARFLALLEKAMSDTGGLIAQLTFLPSEGGDEDGLRVNASATLARIEAVHRQEVGARVEVVGEARIKLEDIAGREPYITGVFTHIPQMGDVGTYVPSEDELAQVKEVTDYIENSVKDVLALSDKILADTPSDAARRDSLRGGGDNDSDDEDDDDGEMWTHKEVGNLRSAMEWVDAPPVTIERIEKPVSMDDASWTDFPEGFEHNGLTRAERLSFAVLQIAPASTASDLQKLIACRAVAMSTDHGLMDRLRLCVSVLDNQLSTLRAKVALKNLSANM